VPEGGEQNLEEETKKVSSSTGGRKGSKGRRIVKKAGEWRGEKSRDWRVKKKNQKLKSLMEKGASDHLLIESLLLRHKGEEFLWEEKGLFISYKTRPQM